LNPLGVNRRTKYKGPTPFLELERKLKIGTDARQKIAQRAASKAKSETSKIKPFERPVGMFHQKPVERKEGRRPAGWG